MLTAQTTRFQSDCRRGLQLHIGLHAVPVARKAEGAGVKIHGRPVVASKKPNGVEGKARFIHFLPHFLKSNNLYTHSRQSSRLNARHSVQSQDFQTPLCAR